MVIALTVVLFNGRKKPDHRFDERVTLRKRDKIPYGSFVAFQNLKYLFPEATINIKSNEPGYWDSLSNYDSGQALLIISPQFLADDAEMKKLILFATAGNEVFISARRLSVTALDMLKCKSSFSFEAIDMIDSLKLILNKPPFTKKFISSYPGKRFDTYLFKFDSTITHILGVNDEGDPNFIRLQTGKGNIYLHLAPLAFSNYFLLHKNNMLYYENVLSVISSRVTKVVWDEYYLTKFFGSQNDETKKGLFGVLFQFQALKWALLTAIFTLLMYVLLEMRRKQRMIPVITKPRNDSLDFVKTIGRLYYEKGDHKNLSRKMGAYFLEHIRNRYKLPTTKLDETFIHALHLKTGYAEKEIRQVVNFISFSETVPAISDRQLAGFHKQLELFYKNA